MRRHPAGWLCFILFGLGTVPASLIAGPGPVQIPIHGFSGTLALPESVDKFYSDVNKVLVKTGDGLDHLGRKPKSTDDGDAPSLGGLQSGTPVFVQYVIKGHQLSADAIEGVAEGASKANEGIVTKMDSDRHQLTIRFSDGSIQTLHHPRGVAGSSTRAIVSFTNRSGRTVAHYWR